MTRQTSKPPLYQNGIVQSRTSVNGRAQLDDSMTRGSPIRGIDHSIPYRDRGRNPGIISELGTLTQK